MHARPFALVVLAGAVTVAGVVGAGVAGASDRDARRGADAAAEHRRHERHDERGRAAGDGDGSEHERRHAPATARSQPQPVAPATTEPHTSPTTTPAPPIGTRHAKTCSTCGEVLGASWDAGVAASPGEVMIETPIAVEAARGVRARSAGRAVVVDLVDAPAAVVAPAGAMARTGLDAGALAATGGASLGAGALLVLASRVRRSSS